jgi:hypothetical protein
MFESSLSSFNLESPRNKKSSADEFIGRKGSHVFYFRIVPDLDEFRTDRETDENFVVSSADSNFDCYRMLCRIWLAQKPGQWNNTHRIPV